MITKKIALPTPAKITPKYIYTRDCLLEIPSIEPEEVKKLVGDKEQQCVIFIYYYYAGQTYPAHEHEDPIVGGEKKIRELMELLGEKVKYYKINIQKYRHTDLFELLQIEDEKNEALYPKFYFNVANFGG